MKLRFIGKDGSMGLKHGKVYPVHVISLPSHTEIYVTWFSVKLGRHRRCPYSSPAAFAANWASEKES